MCKAYTAMNKSTIYINGVIGTDTKLLDVIRQYKSYENATEIEVFIDSVGGCVDTGMSIFNYLRNLQLPVTTIAKKAYSIAASIFMAGDKRIVESGSDRIMIHFPWASVDGGANHLESVAKELRTIEKDFVQFYSTYTSIDSESVQTLLQNETFLSSDEALEIGIATEIKQQLQAVAIFNNKEEEKNEMTKKEKLLNAINAFFTAEEIVEETAEETVEETAEIKALVIQDSNGDTIDFYELVEGDEPEVGDKAKDADGKPLEGSKVLPNDSILPNGTVLEFEAGELKTIKPAEAEEEVEGDETAEDELEFEALMKMLEDSLFAKLNDAMKSENEELKSEIKALKKLIGSEEVSIQARNHNPNTNKTKGSNYLRA